MEPSSELALALTRAHKIAKSNGGSILRSEQLQRSDRELLLRLHWLQEIIKGWYLLTSPNAPAGDSTIWYANFWEFLHIYLGFHLDQSYCLSAESSLDLHTKTSIIPHQVIVIAPTGRGSRHIPLPKEALIDTMETLFECLKKEESAAVRAILGHYIFVYIHPYMDGNGRIGRFLMNTMLASGGYPWTIIRVKNREQYLNALETAGVDANIEPFVQFIRQEMQKS